MRRFSVVAVLVALVVSLTPSIASAWSNGGSSGNGYGTHDWILDRAVALAGESGSWVRLSTALAATDDPDTSPSDIHWHLFREIGQGRGAAQAVADLYAEVVAAHRAGDDETASYKLGLLAHYFGDITQPFHSAFDGLYYNSTRLDGNLHLNYEMTMDKQTQKLADHDDWSIPQTPTPLADARARTVSAARYSRKLWVPLRDALLATNGTDLSNSVVTSVTAQALTRACNDLAEIVRAVPAGTGLAKPPASLTAWMSQKYPSQAATITAYARCRDARGRPMEGVGVVFSWPTTTGVVTQIAYTDSKGLAYDREKTDVLPLMRAVKVAVSSSTGGSTRTAATYFKPTPTLAAGAAGFKNVVSPTRPRRGTVVTATTTVMDAAGLPVSGLKVTFTWRYRYTTRVSTVVTDANGVAVVARNIGRATRGYRVSVRAQTVSGGVTRTSTAYFTPR